MRRRASRRRSATEAARRSRRSTGSVSNRSNRRTERSVSNTPTSMHDLFDGFEPAPIPSRALTRRIDYAGSVHDDREIDAVIAVLRGGPQALRIGKNVRAFEQGVA